MNRNFYHYFLLFILVIIPFFLAQKVYSAGSFDTSFGVASYVPVKDKSADDGSIISFNSGGYFLSKTVYDPQAVGVVSENPAVAFNIEGAGTPVIASGNVNVKVNATNGPIKRGDPVTTSAVPGVGMKASRSGFVIGTALDEFSSTNSKEVGKINVALHFYYLSFTNKNNNNILDLLNLSAISVYETPTVVFRYFLAALILVLCIIFGFFSFGRIAGRGIEALGRNPLAARMIQFGIFLNVLVTIAIISAGLVLAYFVLRL